jgi:transcriptional regulator with XRE-family HTH domain
MITARQLTAARALLGLTQEQLADVSHISSGTINKFEKGDSITLDKLHSIRVVLEKKGIEFIGVEGVLRRNTSVRTYTGEAGQEFFYEDLLSTLKEKGGNVTAIFDTQESIAFALGVTNRTQTRRFERLSNMAEVNCLLFNANRSSAFISSFQFRATARNSHQPFFQIIYGNKVAIIVTDGKEITYVVLESASTAQFNTELFEADWVSAIPVGSIKTQIALAV